ncbi:alkylation response protein AidB-like acyl-CoA dehydrogenase [Hamadaea flava]|uniref:Acyl-CoA dehydrogenase n=1 Tax=Hamadaea flava TaxID=1742688 RepID=A0ABV8LPG7_9ACTN|nr:acyl-CoA dehydrogenase family protein [Hamadaea flava]MCP2322513.1 alkylation response protein AidB-like acyl-CoA dehydrogenase [Hamadaea flava]
MMNTAARIADEVLFPAAGAVDRAERVPVSQLDLLAREGFYEAVGGPIEQVGPLVATFAGGCLATAFVWLQHRGPLRAAGSSDEPGVREKWQASLGRGDLRGGIAHSGARPGASGLKAYESAGGWRLTGEAAWVTGWDLIDVLHVAAVGDDGWVRFFFVDAVESDTLRATVVPLSAANASRTATVSFADHLLPADRLVAAEPYADWAAREASGWALNGFLALGVAERCVRLLGDAPAVPQLSAEVAACRTALLTADATSTPAARATASELAMRCATVLAVQTGSRSVLLDSAAQRLVREAAFLLVFGSRPGIRDELLGRIVHSPRAA